MDNYLTFRLINFLLLVRALPFCNCNFVFIFQWKYGKKLLYNILSKFQNNLLLLWWPNLPQNKIHLSFYGSWDKQLWIQPSFNKRLSVAKSRFPTHVLKNRLHLQSFLNQDSFLNRAFLNRDSTVLHECGTCYVKSCLLCFLRTKSTEIKDSKVYFQLSLFAIFCLRSGWKSSPESQLPTKS